MAGTKAKPKDPAAVHMGQLGAAKRWGRRPKCSECGRTLPLAKTGKAGA
jgi:hypothetical protein